MLYGLRRWIKVTGDLTDLQGNKWPLSCGSECHSRKRRLMFQGERTLFLNLLPSSMPQSVGGHRFDVISM